MGFWVVPAVTAAVAAAVAPLVLREAARRVVVRASKAARGDIERLLEEVEALPRTAIEEPWLAQTTVCVKTFHRPQCIADFLRSLKRRYPAARVRVADDSIVPLFPDGWNRGGVTWHALPFDQGISAGRNWLIDRVETPFLVIADDDDGLTERTDLGRLHDVLVRTGCDLVAGRGGGDVTARFRRVGDLLLIERGVPMEEVEPGVFATHRTANFFMARTERMRQLRWNDELKVLEHTEFFYRAWRAGWRVVEIPAVEFGSNRDCAPGGRWRFWVSYGRFRGRVRWPSRIVRRLTGRPYLPTFEQDGLRRVKTVETV